MYGASCVVLSPLLLSEHSNCEVVGASTVVDVGSSHGLQPTSEVNRARISSVVFTRVSCVRFVWTQPAR